MDGEKDPVLHICVIGFHHKKGCQLEFCYPSLPEANSLPDEWKTLPSLAMPDGAHNYERDTVFFLLPGVKSSANRTIFGISCFLQVPTDSVKNRTDDMTRSAVQKAVCVLTSVPLFGYIQVKMQLVTTTFFERGDFSDVEILKNTYHHLNDCLRNHFDAHKFDGFSVRDFVLKFRHRSLLLFKLLLLERRVLFFCSPVEVLCSTLLTLVTLVPGLLENGLYQAACLRSDGFPQQLSPSHITNTQINQKTADLAEDALLIEDFYSQDQQLLPEKDKTETDSPKVEITMVENLDLPSCGLPLAIFAKGNFCYPYLSISYLDFLASDHVRGFLVGASNVLFKQKRDLTDVIVDLENNRIETQCVDLRRQLSLTTEDLRFADLVIRGITEPKENTSEGSEEWVRSHFAHYLLSMLRTSLLTDGREYEPFNSSFIAAWRNTHHYKMWSASEHPGIWTFEAGHPSSGALSVSDVKLRITQAMSSESGRKLNQAVANTGRAVGGAINQARGVLSGWWSNFTAPNDVKNVKDV